jgi:hypothetical protein
LSCADPKWLQQICDGLSAEKIDALLRKWLRLLPHPFTGADRQAGYRYDISILQAEFALTQVLDRSAHGRLFFEPQIRIKKPARHYHRAYRYLGERDCAPRGAKVSFGQLRTFRPREQSVGQARTRSDPAVRSSRWSP